MTTIKSKQRVANHGEVFTPAWLVEAMLDCTTMWRRESDAGQSNLWASRLQRTVRCAVRR